MNRGNVERWLNAWGYSDTSAVLHRASSPVPGDHRYRVELEELLGSPIYAKAIFDVEGIPTICFIEDDGRGVNNSAILDEIRQKIWNQNLISIVLVVGRDQAQALPVNKRQAVPDTVRWVEASKGGVYSRRDVESGDVFVRHPEWFAPESRVDQDLLRNLEQIVREEVNDFNLEKSDAQYLMAQILFIAYLEHRNIVGDVYRKTRSVGRLKDLVASRDRQGLIQLLRCLKQDFNGDFLEPEAGGPRIWRKLPDLALGRLNDFLGRVDLATGQQSLWNYDFRYIPVELISGIYESFLSDDKRNVGAYYTPRNLATLVVDQAFSSSQDILSERIFDGACGSGILLTTSYRRMLAYAQAKKGRTFTFLERRELLENHIFGSDLSDAACRVSAFSLYLSMLEGLQPSDVALLTDSSNVKLPTLQGKNLFGGKIKGDFFSPENGHNLRRDFTLFISNPPWVEPGMEEWLSSDEWAKQQGIKLPRRQTAAAFMLRAPEFLVPEGRLCLVLPVSVIAAPTSQAFMTKWLGRCRLESLTNFGDLRNLLFENAKQPCVIALARPRNRESWGKVDARETFEYWVPKADVSYAFGRLTLHASDRHILQVASPLHDNSIFTTLFWGTHRDIAFISRLRLQGTLEKLFDGSGRWATRKGFHKKDKSIDNPDSAEPLRKRPYLSARCFDASTPVLDPNTLEKFPATIETVARLSEGLKAVFKGPRILFVDGMTSARGIKAIFSDKEFSFNSSIGVISGPANDGDLLRFVAAYLHSDLATYMLLLTAYQANFERERITLENVRGLPFVLPEEHPNPKHARAIVRGIATRLRQLEKRPNMLHSQYDKRDFEPLFYDYFGITKAERGRITEVATQIAPHIQPGSYKGLNSPLTTRPGNAVFSRYADAMLSELQFWRDKRGGRGIFNISVNINSTTIRGPVGIVRVDVRDAAQSKAKSTAAVIENDRAVTALLQTLGKHKLLPFTIHPNLSLASDVVIRMDNSIFLIKPLVARLWFQSEAQRDATRIVESVEVSPHSREVAG